MSEMLRLCAFAVTAALGAFLLKAVRHEAGAAVALAAGVMLCGAVMSGLAPAVEAAAGLSKQAGVPGETVGRMLRLVGIAYVAEFACQTCRDAGEEGLARKTALCGKLLLLAQTLPLIQRIAEVTQELIA